MNSIDGMDAQRWFDKKLSQAIRAELNKMGLPRLLIPGVVSSIAQVPAASGKYFASVFLNGSTTASTNIPVNPDIASNVAANTPVWVMAVNFDSRDMYVLARKLA